MLTRFPSSFRLVGRPLFVAAAFVLLASVAAAKPQQMPPISLEWKPSGDVKINVSPAPFLPARIVVTALRDTRDAAFVQGVKHAR